jgi:four helix bundle protein
MPELRMKNLMKNKEKEEWKKEFGKRLIRFSVDVLTFCHSLETERVLRPVADQLARSATSVGANVFEAHGAASKKDFAHFFQISLKSAKETQYWLVVVEQYKGHSSKARALLEEVKEVTKILNAALLTMKGSR